MKDFEDELFMKEKSFNVQMEFISVVVVFVCKVFPIRCVSHLASQT